MTPDIREQVGHITPEEAHEILNRFITSHWREEKAGEQARFSIPADPKRDDDIRMACFIDQQTERIKRLEKDLDVHKRAYAIVQEKLGISDLAVDLVQPMINVLNTDLLKAQARISDLTEGLNFIKKLYGSGSTTELERQLSELCEMYLSPNPKVPPSPSPEKETL